ncbi:MAG: sigma-70 family RNA polymerase sigma factor [Candidatus Omnitrophica bacterium]|nr:sigma-70 family RNA polymerase sigma factor [Candidatus Omnitrophota bacterium]
MTNNSEDDTNLVEGCINKDLRAWATFIKKYSNLISISIENRLKKYGFSLPHQDIEDIRQNVLASIWKDSKLEGVKNRNDISYWLAIVAGNEAMMYLKIKRGQETQKKISLYDRVDEKELAEFIPSDRSSPLDELARKELSKKVKEAIESLPAKEKLIIKLNVIYDKKYNDIANILDLPKGTVSSYIKRAKERLKKVLKDFLQ